MSITLPPHFTIQQQDPRLEAQPTSSLRAAAAPIAPPAVPLGVLSNFTGTFLGTGFNTIFRPNSDAPTTTTFPNPVNPAPPAAPSENVLELNLTNETLCFAKPLGAVPNRGLQAQNDLILNGVPYTQTINDVTNPVSGKADGNPSGIHFEPGLWMHIPATTSGPVQGESLVRMASIPHGTTINAQCLVPTIQAQGGPQIPKVDITPFVIGGTKKIPFIAQTAARTDTPRLPQDLSKFIAQGTITQAVLDDPNTVLRNANQGKNITHTTVFTVNTVPTNANLGGGTDNIAFLQGNGSSNGPTADAAQMQATFWINTVSYQLQVPKHTAGSGDLELHPTPANNSTLVPTFRLNSSVSVTEPKTITVTSTEIQYSQLVLLNFAGLSWPHASVATLVPEAAHSIPASALS